MLQYKNCCDGKCTQNGLLSLPVTLLIWKSPRPSLQRFWSSRAGQTSGNSNITILIVIVLFLSLRQAWRAALLWPGLSHEDSRPDKGWVRPILLFSGRPLDPLSAYTQIRCSRDDSKCPLWDSYSRRSCLKNEIPEPAPTEESDRWLFPSQLRGPVR